MSQFISLFKVISFNGEWSNIAWFTQHLKLESFKNFDFNEWIQRYINWIRDKKFRVTDFFRRQDKNGEGTLLRQQFVEGMMTSSTWYDMQFISSIIIFYSI